MARLQDGIYWDTGRTPPRFYGIAFLKAGETVDAAAIDDALRGLALLWDGLKGGSAPTLPGVNVPASGLEWLLGYGVKAFDVTGATRKSPRSLRPPNTFNSVSPLGGGLAVDGSGLSYAPLIARNTATEEFCVQFTAETPLAVTRALVETSLALEAMVEPETQRIPLSVSATFTGFNREDHRSWIDFHDGLSNLRSGDERRSVIRVKPQGLVKGDRWLVGGTYMAFMRLRVDVRLWRTLDTPRQEATVGRAKASGCPLAAVTPAGEFVAVAGCPAGGASEVIPGDVANQQFLEPPDGVNEALQVSHVQRANKHIVKQRVFRQGYEFYEISAPGRPFEVGLNFVSFQENPDRLFFILKHDGWLGKTNFGGLNDPELLHVIAGGVYACPPIVEGEPYPGAATFAPPAVA